MKKLLVYIVLFISFILVACMVFLLLRPCDYQVRFTVKTTPDIAYFQILNWHTWNRKQVPSKIEITDKAPVKSVSHKVLLNDTTLLFNWDFKTLNDSVTRVRVRVSDPFRKLYNRFTVPFTNTCFKKSVENNVRDNKTRLELLLRKFNFEFTGYTQFEERRCVFIELKNTTRGKAGAMISTVAELNQFVRQNNLVLNGHPFVVVHDWNELEDSINFDFCFPIIRTEIVPEHPEIKFKKVEGMDAVKTDFYGNYSISDISWYNLDEEARKMGYRSNHKVIEVYHHDPHSGGNELEWKAEIYLGIESLSKK